MLSQDTLPKAVWHHATVLKLLKPRCHPSLSQWWTRAVEAVGHDADISYLPPWILAFLSQE